MHTQQMISSHPHVQGNINQALIHCIDLCNDCAEACTICADACLGEKAVSDLTQCIRLNLDCADLCFAAATVSSRRTGSNETVIRRTLEACAEACTVCAEECERHAQKHQHCRTCGEVCRRCLQACRDAVGTLRARH